jgi:cell division transport system ATP-binding protein
MAVVRLEHIGKRYAPGAPVLSDGSLEIAAGEFAVLTGASGGGKTTLLKLIYLAERPSHGKLTVFDADTAPFDRPARAALRRRIGIVFQDLRLIDRLSVFDNVAVPLRIAGIAERQVRENVPELLAWVGIVERSDSPAAALSAGERQLVAVARAVVGRPELLIADEPTGSVDEAATALLVRVFERINQLGTTVLIATHGAAFAGRLAHRRFHLDRGVLTADEAASPQ